MKKKSIAAIIAIVLILTVAVGGTIAWLVATTNPIENTFTPGSVTSQIEEKFDGTTKSDVRVQNTGNADAYIRATIVVNWVDDAGNVYAEVPADCTYDMQMESTLNWTKLGNYYYYNGVVAPNGYTGYLIKSCTESAPDGYNLQVTILAEAIQAEGVDNNGKPAVEAAWGVKFVSGAWA